MSDFTHPTRSHPSDLCRIRPWHLLAGGSRMLPASSCFSPQILSGYLLRFWTTTSLLTTLRLPRASTTSTGSSSGLSDGRLAFADSNAVCRFGVNCIITFGYFGFWHVALYLLGWGERPFVVGRKYRLGKVKISRASSA